MKFSQLLVLLIFFSTYISAQDDQTFEAPKHVIHASGGYAVLAASANLSYDYRISQKETGFFKSYYATAKVNYQTLGTFAPGSSSEGYAFTAGITGLTGKGKGHFETSLGLSYFIETNNEDEGGIKDNIILPSLSLGYRRQITKGLVFRTGVGFTELLYVGFGYSF